VLVAKAFIQINRVFCIDRIDVGIGGWDVKTKSRMKKVLNKMNRTFLQCINENEIN